MTNTQTSTQTTVRHQSIWANRGIRSTLHQVNQLVPRFRLEKGKIDVLNQPAEFYSLLKQKILDAKERVFLASLYIGTEEHDLVATLDSALARNPNLHVHILVDALRGTREAPKTCSASLVAPLADKFGSRRVHLHLYHTPMLNGIKQQFIPRRFNEGWGLQHMKLYGFDEEIILSGANLSNDYFTNRQDRYMLFQNKPLTDYFFKIFSTVSKLSYDLLPSAEPSGFEMVWPHYIPEPTSSPNEYILEATKMLSKVIRKHGQQDQPEITEISGKDDLVESDASEYTYVYPISQFSQLLSPDTSTEFPVLSRVFSMLGSDHFNWTLTAGYFNIHPEFAQKLLVTKPSDKAEVITAAPEANGFYQSAGVSRLLPGAYSHLAEKFLKSVYDAGKKEDITLYEWKRGVAHVGDGWTYHAKGIWATLPDEKLPCLTVIGSSNYTRRAYSHDLESNVLLVTSDAGLQQKLKDEIDNLKEYTQPMALEDYEKDETRRLDWRQRAFCKYFGDKL